MLKHDRRRLGQTGLSRRHLLAGSATALAATTFSSVANLGSRAAAQDNQIIMTTGGGAWEAAQDIAYFEPFTAETGIEIVKVPEPEIAQVRAMVETGNTTFDLSSGTGAGIAYTLAEEGLLEPIDYSHFEQETLDGMFPEGKHEFGVASLLYSLILGYNTETFGDAGPATWAEFWDLDAFQGPRTLGTGIDSGPCTWEVALLADGVAPEELYPIDFDRALTSLDRVRADIVAWWDVGGIPAQLLTDGQVNLVSAWNGRIQTLMDEGLPATINWNQGILQWDLMYVPKGAPHPENAMQLLAFMSRADRQAVFAENIAYAPSNANAYEFIPEERAAILPTAPDLMTQQIPQDFAFWDSEDPETGKKMLDIAAERWNEWLIG